MGDAVLNSILTGQSKWLDSWLFADDRAHTEDEEKCCGRIGELKLKDLAYDTHDLGTVLRGTSQHIAKRYPRDHTFRGTNCVAKEQEVRAVLRESLLQAT